MSDAEIIEAARAYVAAFVRLSAELDRIIKDGRVTERVAPDVTKDCDEARARLWAAVQ